MRDVVIIGSGPAGLTAAIYAARANLNPLVFAGEQPGGQLMLTSVVENFPGFPDGIDGFELMQRMSQQATNCGAEIVNENVINIDFSQYPYKVATSEQEHFTKSIIFATGSSAKWLGLKSEARLRGHGVSSCAVCDGAFFRGKSVAVVGGGDTALEEALFLTKFASEVLIIHRGDSLRASKILQERVNNNPKIDVWFNSTVEEILGTIKVTGVTITQRLKPRDFFTDYWPIDGVFVAIGHHPNTELMPSESWSNLPLGVFTAGDVTDHHYRQAITAASSGCMAAMDVERYLNVR